MRSSGTAARAIRQWWIGWTSSPVICDPAVALRERVERRVDRALERVLDRDQRPLDAALADRGDGVVDGRERDRLEAGGPVARQHRLLAVGPGRAEEADPASLQRGGGLAGERPAHGLRLLGRELELARPSTTDLQ